MISRTSLAAVRLAAVSTLFLRLVVLAANAASLSGVVQSGGTSFSFPLSNVNVTLFEATSGSPNVLGTATSNALGQFTIASSINTTPGTFFVTADVAAGVKYLTILGPNLPAFATINELTTVAGSYSMAQFYKTGVISGNSFGLKIASMMNDNIVVAATGASSPVLLNSPNADETNSLRSTRTLANLLVACLHSHATVAQFLTLTTRPGGPAPHDTAEALADLARNPGQSVSAIYLLPKLYDGLPLYGQFGPPSFTPLMRLTNSLIDQAGNVWALNNWKPDFNIDVTQNPGGDGVVIFVGLATPPRQGP
jgi:hypothetical protein